jgi:hypothetical protein
LLDPVAALPVPFGGSIPEVIKSVIAPKLQILFSILKSYVGKPGFCGILFVEKRSTAEILVQAIRFYKPFAGHIKPGILVGHGQNGSLSRFSGSKMMAKDQERTIKEFRRGTINLLIATKVNLGSGGGLRGGGMLVFFNNFLIPHSLSHLDWRRRS